MSIGASVATTVVANNQSRTLIQRMFGLNRDSGFKRQHLRTGSTRPIKVNDEDAAEVEVTKAPGLQQWQELVLLYADKVPIASSGARFYEDSTKRVKFYLAEEETGQAIEGLSGADEIITILNVYNEEISRAVGLRYLIGESRHTFDRNTKELTTRGAGELYCRKDGTYVIKDRAGKERDLDQHLDIWRSYDPDRKWSDLATSSHKPMIDILEAFVIAYAEERAVSIRNALNTGILGVSEEVFMVGGDEDVVNSEGSGEGAALEARFQQMLQMTIKNPRDSANFVTPVLITPAGRKPSESVEHISIAADRDKRKIAERIRMLKEEYAVGADLPSDQAQGFLADMNHWNGKIVGEAAWTDYLAPKIEAVVHDAFEEIATALGIDVTGLTVGLDNSQLVSPSDMTDSAFRAYENGLISDASARKHTGFTEEDAPGADDEQPTDPVESDDETAATEEVPEDQGDGIVAAAGKEATNLKKLNRELRVARLNFERELREAVMEAALELAPPTDENGAAVTAAADPGSPDPVERIAANISRIVRRGQEAIGLAAARGLATKRAGEWYTRHEARLAAQAERAGADGAKLIDGWLKTRGATSIPGRDAYGIARSIESVGAGGPSSIHANGTPTQARPKAIMEDDDFLAMIEEEGSAAPEYTWEHGTPPMPFAPHANLDGTSWDAAEEREVLDNPDDFPPSAIYHPGDHDGCTCRYDVEFVRTI